MTRSRLRQILAMLALLAVPAAARADVKLAVAAPITGASAAFGAQLKNGAEQAVEDINKTGGILGQRIDFSVGDDVSDPRQGVSIANKFVGDGVKFVIGHFNSGVTIPASRVYFENNILMITPGATNPQLTEKGRWNIFRTCGRDDQQGKVAGEYLLSHFKGKKIAILHDKTTYGKGLADQVRKYLNAHDVTEVLYEPINPGEKDYSAVVSKIKSAGADIVYWGGLQTEAGLLIRQMRDQGMQTMFMGGDGIVTDELATIAGPGVVGTLMTFPPDARRRPEAAAVVKEFLAKNYNPEAYTLYSYAAVQIVKQAAEKANSLEPKKVADVMHGGMAFRTVIGDISYDKKGDIQRPDYVVYVWKKMPDGSIQYVQQ